MHFLFYAIICLLLGFIGAKRKIGFMMTFLLSLLITPLVMAIFLLLTAEKKPRTTY